MSYVKIGIGGPIGAGKTRLSYCLSHAMSKDYSMCIVTNDIFSREDEKFLKENSALDPERIIGIETGGCPHTAIREDCSMNLEAVEDLAVKYPDAQIIIVESGGDNLSANFSPDLADATIYIIDVAQGEEIPRKGGPGLTRSDLLVINKIDLAPHVEVNLDVMARDAAIARDGRPFVFTNLKTMEGLDKVVDWIKKSVLLEE